MNNTFEATGQIGMNVSALNLNDKLNFTARDVTAEKISQGHYARASTFISDDEANNNARIINRDGSRQYVDGNGYEPTDLIKIEGMEIPYETAVALGVIQGNQLVNPQANQGQPSDTVVTPQGRQEDGPLSGADLLNAQIELAVGDDAPAVLATFGDDIVTNGEISEAGFRFAQEKLGMNESSAKALYEDMREKGSQVMAGFMDHGDSLSKERMAFLVDLAETGTREEQAIVRNLWFQAATGKLSKASAADAFDYLYAPYEN